MHSFFKKFFFIFITYDWPLSSDICCWAYLLKQNKMNSIYLSLFDIQRFISFIIYKLIWIVIIRWLLWGRHDSLYFTQELPRYLTFTFEFYAWTVSIGYLTDRKKDEERKRKEKKKKQFPFRGLCHIFLLG